MPLMTPSVKSGAKISRLSQLTKPVSLLPQRMFFEGMKWLLFSEGCSSFVERYEVRGDR